MGLSVTDPSSVNGPWWLGFAGGGVFAAAGLAVAVQETPVGVWVGPIAVGLVLLGFAALGNWIAFGAGPRACTGGVSFLFFSGPRAVGEMECRVAFGLGAVIVDGLLVMGVLKGVAKLLPPGASVWSVARERLGRGGGDGRA